MRTQAELHALTREVLGADYVELQVARYTLTEDLAEEALEQMARPEVEDEPDSTDGEDA